MIFSSLVETVVAAISPKLIRILPFSILYGMGFLALSVSLVALTLVERPNVALFFISLTGLSYAFTNTFPFMITARQYNSQTDTMGLFMGALDACTYVPMLIDVMYSPFLSSAVVFRIGAGWATIAALAAVVVRPPPGLSRRTDIMV
jgi:branched-subunit amino acid transport protein AzlD